MTVLYGHIGRMGSETAVIKGVHATLERNLAGEETPEAPRKVRGADTERRASILDKADEVFLEEGFQAASMSAIAARVGGSKGTLYNYFASKEDLFLACVTRQCEDLRTQMSSLAAEKGSVRETLTRVGQRYVEVVSSDNVVRRFRMIVAEAERAPELARAFFETGPAQGRTLLAEYIERATQAGELAADDPVRAADHFLGLCYNRLSKARLCGVEPAPSQKMIEQEVAAAVRVFMAAYGPGAA